MGGFKGCKSEKENLKCENTRENIDKGQRERGKGGKKEKRVLYKYTYSNHEVCVIAIKLTMYDNGKMATA